MHILLSRIGKEQNLIHYKLVITLFLSLVNEGKYFDQNRTLYWFFQYVQAKDDLKILGCRWPCMGLHAEIMLIWCNILYYPFSLLTIFFVFVRINITFEREVIWRLKEVILMVPAPRVRKVKNTLMQQRPLESVLRLPKFS